MPDLFCQLERRRPAFLVPPPLPPPPSKRDFKDFQGNYSYVICVPYLYFRRPFFCSRVKNLESFSKERLISLSLCLFASLALVNLIKNKVNKSQLENKFRLEKIGLRVTYVLPGLERQKSRSIEILMREKLPVTRVSDSKRKIPFFLEKRECFENFSRVRDL